MPPLDTTLSPTLLWAQTAPGRNEMPLLALRRWFWGQTLASPSAVPRLDGLWAWLLGLMALLLVAAVAQGPRKALGQCFDLPGLARLVRDALRRLGASSRMLMIVLGAAVLSWTSALLLRYRRPSGLDDLQLVTRTKSPTELAIEGGSLAALTPLRDVFSLADLLLLLVLGTTVVFRYSADRWGEGDRFGPPKPLGRPAPAWTSFSWVALALYGLYRLVSTLMPTGDLPLGGGLFVEPLAIPALMVLSDALLASWVLVELRRDGRRAGDVGPMDVSGTLELLPGALLATLLVLPSRAVATAAYLTLPFVPNGVARTVVGPLLNGWGLIYLQGAALLFAGVAGSLAWCRGGWGTTLRGYGRLLRCEGGRLVATLGLAGFAAGVPAALAYLVVLSLPSQPWVLPAADAYAHYATLPIGLATLSALVELGRPSVAATSATEVAVRLEDAAVAPA